MSTILDDDHFCENIRDVQRLFGTPGISVTVVDIDANTHESKGFVLPGHDISINDDTLLTIASNTKLFVVFAVGVLIDEGKIPGWDARLCDLLPDLNLVDKYANDTLTLAQVFSHQTGLAGHWLLHCNQTLKAEDAVAIYNEMRPSAPVRAETEYENGGFFLGGELVRRLSGLPFTDFVNQRILQPLGMINTKFSFDIDEKRVIKPFEVCRSTDNVVEIGYRAPRAPKGYWGQPGGGGGIHSTGPDMAIWMAHLLKMSRNDLGPDEHKILNYETFSEMIRGRALATEQIGALPTRMGESLWPEITPPIYALGQLVFNYRGRKISSHNGTTSGCSSMLLWLPGEKFGIYVAGNTQSSSANVAPAIVLLALDHIWQSNIVDWGKRMKALPHHSSAYPDIPTSAGELTRTHKIGGTYEHKHYGIIYVVANAAEDGQIPPEEEQHLLYLKEAIKFGQRSKREADYFVIFKDDMLVPYYIALYHVEADTYFGVRHQLFEKPGRLASYVDIPDSTSDCTTMVSHRFDFSSNELEFYGGWSITDVGPSKGQATFKKL